MCSKRQPRTKGRKIGSISTSKNFDQTSRDLLQFVSQDPPVLAFMGFNSEPVGSGHNNQYLGSRGQRLKSSSGVEGRRLERRSGRLYQSLNLTPQIVNALLQCL